MGLVVCECDVSCCKVQVRDLSVHKCLFINVN